MTRMKPPNAARLQADLEWMEQFTDPECPYTRRAFTDLFLAARRRLGEVMEAAGLRVCVDAAGNLIGRREGRRRDLPPIMLGFHIDTVVGGGRFDGVIGVLGAIEVVRWLTDNSVELDHPLEVVDFLSEEPSDYGISTVGSRGMVGALTPDMLVCRNPAGETLAEGIARMGGDPSKLNGPLRRPGEVSGYLELHIEQGPVLDRMNRPISIVKGIVGIRRWEIRIGGRPDHAGTTPMTMRMDALAAGAEVILAVERLARAAHDAVGTVGRVEVHPNTPNVVPGEVRLIAEMRSLEETLLERLESELRAEVSRIARARGMGVAVRRISAVEPVMVRDEYLAMQQEAFREMGLEPISLVSGAGHDAGQLSRICPVGMFFVRCREGRSHSADEWAELGDLMLGTEILGRTVLKLDR